LARRMHSAPSTCQTSCGRVARAAVAAGRRPRGAGFRPARLSHRWAVRGDGQSPAGDRCRRIVSSQAAPQVGCSRRSWSTAARLAAGLACGGAGGA